MPSGRFEKKFKAELRKNALRRILLLVVFLDGAKINNVISSSPRLFSRNGIVKSSREILAILCRDYMRGEGNVFKHLTNIGVGVSYQQKYIDELKYTVSNLAVDLRDGVLLAKLAETLTGDNGSSIFDKMRLPAVSRLQKLHNVGIALSS